MTGEALPPGGGGELARTGLRASHADRDRVVELLRVAAGDGRLTADELDERLEKALTARTYGELAVLTTDLPAGPGHAVAAQQEPKDLVRVDCRSGTTKREGSWVVPQRMEVRVRSGTVTLDFTKAVIGLPVLQLDADVHSGSLVIVTRPGVEVDADDVAVRSGVIKAGSPWRPDVPVTLQIQVTGTVGSGVIKAVPPRQPRRTFWQWLRRQPRPPRPFASALR